MTHACSTSLTTPTRRDLIVALILTGTLTLLEIAGAWKSDSMALWGEAAHFIADAWAFAVAWYALTPAPADSRLSFGRGQAVALGGLVNAVVQGVIGLAVGYAALRRLWLPEPVEGGWMLGVAVLGLGLNVVLLRRFGGAHGHHHDAIEGARIHFVADAGLCAATVLAATCMALGGPVWVDAVLAMFAAGLMVVTAAQLLRRVSHTLLAGVPHPLVMHELLAELGALPEVVEAHHLHVWAIGSRKMGSVHVVTPTPNAQVLRATQAVFAAHGVDHATVQLEAHCADAASSCGPTKPSSGA